ncbi:hypothetical protein S7711_11523 [Stachybotrys chartarum IBT 7711]|uniref:Uncharacterized protein n=1 Tax=Stachybotrys chartarum (strain CBS 109288 / IBT 7711) TaxID=1280523 RepID=A0A084AJU6_STACB|nr:hypothetical protein S7711_11523 [Stachybotrys chartarum IBT 7711]
MKALQDAQCICRLLRQAESFIERRCFKAYVTIAFASGHSNVIPRAASSAVRAAHKRSVTPNQGASGRGPTAHHHFVAASGKDATVALRCSILASAEKTVAVLRSVALETYSLDQGISTAMQRQRMRA